MSRNLALRLKQKQLHSRRKITYDRAMIRSIGRLFTITLSVAVLLLSIGVFLWQDEVTDWWLLRNYEPPAEIVQLADDTTMNDKGRRYFYVYRPQLLSSDTFRNSCTIAEKSIVLGCYVSRQGIYIYDVEDERLEGIRQVTAAHEMLHVAYERLSASEQERIDRLTAQAYAELADERIERVIAAYEARDPGVVSNELHSILPTEVREIGPELEEYYRQYFTNRTAIVELAEQYAEVFDEARQLVERLDEQLRTELQEIEFVQLQLEADARRLERERDELNRLLDANRIAEYNRRVDPFNAGVRAYNQTVSSVRSMVDDYNQLVNRRNEAALDHQSLVESIDSQPQALPEGTI